MAVLRYHRRQRHLLFTADEDVQLFPDARRWTTSRGTDGTSLTDAPLDELSFIYFVRTLPLTNDSAFSVNRHYDPARNPVSLRVLGHEVVRVAAGEFRTILVEMRVREPRGAGGEGVLLLYLSDDRFRIPVRIEGDLPALGRTVFTLESYTSAPQSVAAGGR
jgi:hypothetical protein